MSPRALVWTYFTSIVAAGAAVVVLLAALMLRYLPHDYLEKAGLRCASPSSCGTTFPVWADATFSFLLGGVLVGLVAFAAYAVASRLTYSYRHCDELDLAAEYVMRSVPDRVRGRVLVVDDPAPISYTTGFFRPFIVISAGLFDSLGDDELDAVLAHEEGHLRGRDNLLNLVAGTVAMTFVLVPGVGFAYGRMRRAQELAADAFAGRRTGDPLLVASSLHKFASSLKLSERRVAPAATAFAEEGNIGDRIRGLLDERMVSFSRRAFIGSMLTIALAFGVFSSSAVAFTGVDFLPPEDVPSCHVEQAYGTAEDCTAH